MPVFFLKIKEDNKQEDQEQRDANNQNMLLVPLEFPKQETTKEKIRRLQVFKKGLRGGSQMMSCAKGGLGRQNSDFS